MSYLEERQYLRDQSYLSSERELMEMQEWGEWQEALKQKPAKIVIVNEEEEVEKEEVV